MRQQRCPTLIGASIGHFALRVRDLKLGVRDARDAKSLIEGQNASLLCVGRAYQKAKRDEEGENAFHSYLKASMGSRREAFCAG